MRIPMPLGSHLFHSRAQKNMALRSILSLSGRKGQIYNEEAFRHVLAIERKRAQRSNRSFLLLQVRMRGNPGLGVEKIPPAIADSLLSSLGMCVREVDFVGWHRQGRVVGAVLAQGDAVPDADALPRIAERVITILRKRLPSLESHGLDVRVIPLGRA
jgi:hypothetical protein